jgi:hypothetical protein
VWRNGIEITRHLLLTHTQAFGRNRPPVINTKDMLKREVEVLDGLNDMKAADDIVKAEDIVCASILLTKCD